MVNLLFQNLTKETIGEVAFACYLPGVRDEMKSPLPEGDEPGLIESSSLIHQTFFSSWNAYCRSRDRS